MTKEFVFNGALCLIFYSFAKFKLQLLLEYTAVFIKIARYALLF